MHDAAKYLTPPEYAARIGAKPETVIFFIRSGELRAINTARRGSSRPRYKIAPDAIAEFERRRSTTPMPEPIRRRRTPGAVKSFV